MKQLKLLFPIFIFCCLAWLLGSCCGHDGRITSENGFYFQLTDGGKIQAIELMGTNRVIHYEDSSRSDAYITLNPAETESSYRISYMNVIGPDTSTGEGTVTMKYTRKPSYVGDGCNEELLIVYDAYVSATTFSQAVLSTPFLSATTYVQITP